MVFARRDRGELHRLDVTDLLYDAARLLRRVLPESIQLQTQVARDLPPIEGDAAALEQVLMNLATNARDAMPGGGVLRIEATADRLDTAGCDALGWGRPGEIVKLTVSDTGMGMDASVLDRVYDPFFTTKPVGSGTGLGMSIVYGVIQQHGAHIVIESKPGQGTRIVMRFLAAGQGVASRTDELEARAPSGSETILLVEDNEAVRSAARRILERSGYKVVAATNGQDALQLFQVHANDVALVLADIVMPVMGGIELIEAIRRTGRSPKMLLTSGYTERTRDADRLAVPLLAKPWTPSQLASKIREILDT
jgi:CheY-like chemotaxis protein